MSWTLLFFIIMFIICERVDINHSSSLLHKYNQYSVKILNKCKKIINVSSCNYMDICHGYHQYSTSEDNCNADEVILLKSIYIKVIGLFFIQCSVLTPRYNIFCSVAVLQSWIDPELAKYKNLPTLNSSLSCLS